MPGRYGAPDPIVRRSHARKSRPSRLLRFVGVTIGAAMVSFGIVALVSAGDAAEGQDALADGGSTTLRQGAPSELRDDVNRYSRSGERQPGRLVYSLEKPPEKDEAGPDQAVPSEEADTPQRETPPEEATVAPTGEPTKEPDPDAKPEATAALPDNSGSGRRVVFDITEQQVWLVEDGGEVERTYFTSGSRYDQLPEGTYEVFSKSEEAVSWDYESTMRYMVRFHRGENSNIGFHDIPIYDDTGEQAQTRSELGTPLSDGCIRQAPEDAEALWDFAPVGTAVVVVRT